MQEALEKLESTQAALREALERQDWDAIGELDSLCRQVVDEVMVEGQGNAQVIEGLGELLDLYREVLEACEAEKHQVGAELRQLRQASAGVRAYQDAD